MVRMGQFIRCNGYTVTQIKFPSISARSNLKTMRLAWIGVIYLRKSVSSWKSMTSPTSTPCAGWRSATQRSKICTRWSSIKQWATIKKHSRWKRPSLTVWRWTDRVLNRLRLLGRWCVITSIWWSNEDCCTPSGSRKAAQCVASASPASSASRSSRVLLLVVVTSDHLWTGSRALVDPSASIPSARLTLTVRTISVSSGNTGSRIATTYPTFSR